MNTISLGDRAIVKDLIAVNIGSENKHVSNLWVDNIFPTPGLNLTLQDVCDNGNTTSSNITIEPQSFLLVSNIGTSAQHVNTLWVDNIFPAPGLNLTLQDVCDNGNTTTSNITIQPGSYLFVSNIGDANQKVHKITMESEIEYTQDLDFRESATGHIYLKVKPNRQLAVAGTIKYHEGQIDGTTSLFTAGINTANNYHIRNNFASDTDCVIIDKATNRVSLRDVLYVAGGDARVGINMDTPTYTLDVNGNTRSTYYRVGSNGYMIFDSSKIDIQNGVSTAPIAIGHDAGTTSQGSYATAIGFQAGQLSQNTFAVAIGANAGQVSQKTNAVAVGREAGQTSQNTNAIAIGFQAGHAGQLANTIVLNASGVPLNGDVATDSFYVSPIRANVSSNVLLYNAVTKEVTYGTTLPSASVPTLQQVTDKGNTTSNTVSFTNAGTSLTTSGNVSIGSATSFAGFKLNVEGPTGTGIRLSDTTNDASLRTTFANGTATIEAAKSGAVSTAIDFKTQTSAGSTANTMTLNGGFVGIRGAADTSFPLTITRVAGTSGSLKLVGDTAVAGAPNLTFSETVSGTTAVINYDNTNVNIDKRTFATAFQVGQIINNNAFTDPLLGLSSATTAKRDFAMNYFNADANSSIIQMGKSRSTTLGTLTYPDSGDYLGRIFYNGADENLARFEVGGDLSMLCGSTWTSSSQETKLEITTTPAGSTTRSVNLTLTGAGRLLIGSVVDQGNWKGQVTGNMFIRGSDSTSSNSAIYVDNSTGNPTFLVRNDGLVGFPKINDFTTGSAPNAFISTSSPYGIYVSTSSIRYKKDIRDYDKGLDIVKKLTPVYYKSKSSVVDGDKQFAGFIAEDIHHLGLTEFVNYLEDGTTPNSLAYQNMVVLLTKAIQEQQVLIDALTTRIANLEAVKV